MSLELSGDVQYDFGDALDQFYPLVNPNNFFTSRKISLGAALNQFLIWVHFINSFTSRKMSLGLSGHVQIDLRVSTDQMYPCVHSNNSFSYKKCHWNSVEMCRMTLVVLWANFTHRFIRITLLYPNNVLGTQWRCVV